MRPGLLPIVGAAVLSLGVAISISGGLQAESPAAALSGVVSSPAEGAMEGVVVNARRDGANFTVSVVGDSLEK